MINTNIGSVAITLVIQQSVCLSHKIGLPKSKTTSWSRHHLTMLASTSATRCLASPSISTSLLPVCACRSGTADEQYGGLVDDPLERSAWQRLLAGMLANVSKKNAVIPLRADRHATRINQLLVGRFSDQCERE